MRDRKEYLEKWRENKRKKDPEYFIEAGRKAAKRRKQFLKDNPDEGERVKKIALQNRKDSHQKDPRTSMLADARKRAKKKGLEYSLCKDDIHVPEICPVLGIPLEVGRGLRGHNSPSLDRIDNSRGYLKDNVKVISFRANALKNDASIEELKLIVKYMEEFNNGMVRN